MLGYFHEKFGSKIAWANRKEGDSVGADPGRETDCGGQRPTWWPRLRMWRWFAVVSVDEEGEPWDDIDQIIVFQVDASFP